MKVTDEQLMAYADGELAAAEVERVEAAIAGDPALAAVVARHRALRAGLRDAFAPALDEPVPDRLLSLLREPPAPAANVVPLAPRREAATARRWALPEWSAMAAALVLGVAVSQWGFPSADSLLERGSDGSLVASRGLAGQLDRQLSGAAGDGGVAVGVSFRDTEGGYCRSFIVEASQPLAGLACRRADGVWQVPVVMEATSATGGDLQQAASTMPAALLSELDARIAGEPLDATQEQAARDAGWR